MKKDNTIEAFFALIRGGLWEQEVSLSGFDEVDYNRILLLAEKQAVVGLVAAGLEHVKDVRLPQSVVLQFVGEALQLEQRNMAMNNFIAAIIAQMRNVDIYTLLIKGQGIAQCYERPLWRVPGDIDFFLSNENYQNAKDFMIPLSSENKQERHYSKELGMCVDSWFVELHGSQRTGLSSKLDKEIDCLQKSVFFEGNVRSWVNGNTQVFLPKADEDVLFVFTHFLKHFYKGEGLSLKQLCDWCRLIYCYKKEINLHLLEQRINRMGLMSEWKTFSEVVVEFFGMPKGAMPLYKDSRRLKSKTDRIVNKITKGENKGRLNAVFSSICIFPYSTMRFLPGILFDVNWLKIKNNFFINPSI